MCLDWLLCSLSSPDFSLVEMIAYNPLLSFPLFCCWLCLEWWWEELEWEMVGGEVMAWSISCYPPCRESKAGGVGTFQQRAWLWFGDDTYRIERATSVWRFYHFLISTSAFHAWLIQGCARMMAQLTVAMRRPWECLPVVWRSPFCFELCCWQCIRLQLQCTWISCNLTGP